MSNGGLAMWQAPLPDDLLSDPPAPFEDGRYPAEVYPSGVGRLARVGSERSLACSVERA
jgi:hypothetical protein